MTARLRPALGAGVLAAALVLAAAPVEAAPPRPVVWTPVELGTLGGALTTPTAVNDRGQVVGTSETADGRRHAFLWDDGEMVDLTPDAQSSTATDISDRGEVVGYVQPAPGEDFDAFVWHRGRTTVLAQPGAAFVVNERGQVAGTVETPATWSANPFVWRAGTRTDLTPPPFPGARTSASVVDLNRSGTVLGFGEYDDDRDLAYLWSGGTFTELRDGEVVLRPVDLNDPGHVAGSVHRTSWFREAALWRDGRITRLGLLPGTAHSQALALNDDDLVVGVSAPAPNQRGTAFVWQDGVLTPLTTSGWSLASDVNERGQVAGQLGSTTAEGVELAQPFVWRRGALTPLGEPSEQEVTVVDLSEKGHVLTRTGTFLDEQGVLWVPGAPRS
ncbi:hypothetical protein GC089_03585 [Cellulomonas sp. JZ18]|uniref:hypothetical protein n=1 Tax=Cellulomonas sp. JZ18 TaxID=2654191 RepID=UPI0012D45320|nr:hypothetical protein [Cellulomonas sp. JZ18]QGQ18502.1 hypothetical protein GC089_03585 [Cellulomonas sp. JZ18]